MKFYNIKYLFLVIIGLMTVSCREQAVPQKTFSLYEGTEYLISIISNTSFIVRISRWENVKMRNIEYSEAQSAEIIALLLPILKKCTPYSIEKNLTYDEQIKEMGIPPPQILTQGFVSLRTIADNGEYISIYYYDCDNEIRKSYWAIHISGKEFKMTYIHNDATQIREGIAEILRNNIKISPK